jgi:predicted phosphodiesterase
VCSPHWAEAALMYAQFVASRGIIPYRRWKNIDDFVIEGKLAPDGRIGIIGDWGTGQSDARTVLEQMARKKPQVAIHLGDVYYSATQFEVDNYFYKIWADVLKLPTSGIASYTLAGNHDMFGGGRPYYNLIDRLGQPASYFCLRNDNWQIIALDTGFHDAKPDGKTPTFLEDTEVQWLRDKIKTRGNRRTILLSHHQLFSAFEDICGSPVNEKLNAQLKDILPQIDIWLWGHEHNQVVYKRYLGVLARCIGHGAFPIGVDELPVLKYSNVPVEDLKLRGTPFLDHGYVVVDLNGPAATLSYFVSSDENKPVFTETV